MQAGSCQEDTSPNLSMHTITSKKELRNWEWSIDISLTIMTYEWQDINSELWYIRITNLRRKGQTLRSCNYLNFFFYCGRNKNNSKMYTQNSKKKKSELWDVNLENQDKVSISKYKLIILRNQIRIENQKTCNCEKARFVGSKLRIPRKKSEF